jgi:hypothetical protein
MKRHSSYITPRNLKPGEVCRHLIETLLPCHFGHLHHLADCLVVFREGQFGLIVAEVLEGYFVTHFFRDPGVSTLSLLIRLL